MSAEERYAAYNYEFHYPPKQPSHLIAFAKKSGVKITWGQAKKLIQKAPDTSDYVPPPQQDLNTGQIVPTQPRQRKNTEQKRSEKIATAKRYSQNVKIDQNQLFNRVNKYQYLINQLISMGWEPQQSEEAIKAANGNLQLAIESLMSGELIRPTNQLKHNYEKQNDHALHRPTKPRRQNENDSAQNQKSTASNNYSPQSKAANNQFQSASMNNNYSPLNGGSNTQFQNSSMNNSYSGQNGGNGNQFQNSAMSNNHSGQNSAMNNSDSPNKSGTNFQQNSTNHSYSPPPNRTKKDELQLFLNSLALGHYYNNFINHGFGTQRSGLCDLSEDILIGMGITIMAHRRSILKAVHGPNYVDPFQQTQTETEAQAQTQPQTPTDSTVDLDDAFEKLLGGHGSIKQRLRSMDEILQSLDFMNISADNGKVLLSAFSEQIIHEDYIYREHKVRIKAIQSIAEVFIHCLNKLPFDQIPTLIDNSLPEIFDNLWALLDNNRYKSFHAMAQKCINQICAAIVEKNNKPSVVSVCGLLNEKMDIENMNQPHARFFAAQVMFQQIIFGYKADIINKLFDFDINRYDNKLEKYTNGIQINPQIDVPNDDIHKAWFEQLIATQWNNNDDETFKDIVTDSISILIIDPNCDISVTGSNLAVYFCSFNQDWREYLETEAKYRFKKYYVGQPTPQMPYAQQPLKAVTQQTPQAPVQRQYSRAETGPVDYRIKQQTAVNVAPPVLPSI